ncbi:MAG: hypothetical protein ACRD1Y_14435 [Terriglobales bacterium]
MKLGGEKKGEVIALVVLLGVGAVLLGRTLLAGSGSTIIPVPFSTVSAPSAAGSSALPVSLMRLDPRLHLAQLAALRARTYTGNGRNLFHFGAAPPPPVPLAVRNAAAARMAALAARRRAVPSGPPPPPSMPLTFYGYAQMSGLPERIFLHFGQDSYVVTQGAIVAKRYEIVSIGKVAVRVRDLSTHAVQEVPLQRPAPGQ